MTYPRSQLVTEGEPGFFHVVSRCVRRAFLCGRDKHSGQCFEHRRQWIESRILELADCFAVSIYAYAIMSNHYHVVVHVDPGAAEDLSDDEVASYWLTAFPGALSRSKDPKLREQYSAAIISNPDRLSELRQRLGSLSWFMKALNEPIARRANREDDCKGKFWESRFKCQALLEPHAVLSCMAYVDLNPARAALCDSLAESDHTSIQRRLREKISSLAKTKNKRTSINPPLKPVAGLDAGALLDMTEASYIQLVQWTGEQARWDKRGCLRPLGKSNASAPTEIWQISQHPNQWLRQVRGTESIYFRAIGSAQALMDKAEALGQAWMKGVSAALARRILRERPT